MMRAMLIEFPDDRACDTLDRQYMLGESLLVAPIFTEEGTVDYYLPAGRWTNLLSGQVQEGPAWHHEKHDFLTLPLMVRPGTVLPMGAIDERPDYDYRDGVTFRVYELSDDVELTCAVSGAARRRDHATQRSAYWPTRDRPCLRRRFVPLATAVRRNEYGQTAERHASLGGSARNHSSTRRRKSPD